LSWLKPSIPRSSWFGSAVSARARWETQVWRRRVIVVAPMLSSPCSDGWRRNRATPSWLTPQSCFGGIQPGEQWLDSSPSAFKTGLSDSSNTTRPAGMVDHSHIRFQDYSSRAGRTTVFDLPRSNAYGRKDEEMPHRGLLRFSQTPFMVARK